MKPRIQIVPGHGSGHVVEVYAPIVATVLCGWCNGRGTLPDGQDCAECKGTGEVAVPESWRRAPGALLLLGLLVSAVVGACNPRTPEPFGTIVSCEAVLAGGAPFGTPCVGEYPQDTLVCGKASGSC